MFETQHFLKLTEFQRFYENWRFSACPAVHWVTPRYPFHLKTNSKYHRDRPSEWSRFTEITGSNCKSKPEFYIKLVLLKQLERGILFWPWMNLWNANYTHARTHTPLCSPPSFTLFITLAPSFQAHLVLWAPHKRFPRKRFGHANAQNKKKSCFHIYNAIVVLLLPPLRNQDYGQNCLDEFHETGWKSKKIRVNRLLVLATKIRSFH